MGSRSYRPRPANGSGDSPRPPFLSEFVNHIGKLSLVEVVYHLFGGTLRLRVHPHVQRSFRLKTESARRIVQLQAADSNVGQDSINTRRLLPLRNLREGTLQERNLRPILDRLRQLFARDSQRFRVLIEPNQMSRCAEAPCDFVTVPAKTHRGVAIGPATPYG